MSGASSSQALRVATQGLMRHPDHVERVALDHDEIGHQPWGHAPDLASEPEELGGGRGARGRPGLRSRDCNSH